MKLYLAGPMSGYKDLNFPAFHEAAAKLRAKGHMVFNPAETDFGRPEKEVTHREALAVDLVWICHHAEGMALLPGWRLSKGAQAEFGVALAIGMDTGPIEVFL